MRPVLRAALALSGAFALAFPAASASATATSTAGAGQVSVNTGSGWTHDPTGPLFDFSRIAPGWSATKTIGIRNDGPASAALSLDASNVVDNENGCNHPESVVDTSCSGTDAGELGAEMILAVYDSADTATTPLWRGSIRALEQPATLGSLSTGAVRSLVIAAELPAASGNETQTDSVTFDLAVNLDGATVAVEGTKTTRATGGLVNRALDQLPFTGTPAERLVAAAICLLLLGSAVSLFARGRRAPEVF